MNFIAFALFGLVVGLIARAVMPGKDRMGIIATAVLGVVGALLAAWIGRALGWYGPTDGAGFLMSVIGALVVLFAYNRIVARKRVGYADRDKDYPRRVA